MRLSPTPGPGRERVAFDLRLGFATVTGPSIRCFLRALTPAVGSGCEKKSVMLSRVAPAPKHSDLAVDNEDIGDKTLSSYPKLNSTRCTGCQGFMQIVASSRGYMSNRHKGRFCHCRTCPGRSQTCLQGMARQGWSALLPPHRRLDRPDHWRRRRRPARS